MVDIEIPQMAFRGSFPIIDFRPAMAKATAVAQIAINPNVTGTLSLTGTPTNGGQIFQVETVRFKSEVTANKAEADFVDCTFTAIFGLAGAVTLKIPAANFSLEATFDADPLEVSKVLERRLVASRLMTIERAIGYQFELPDSFTGDEVETIALVYYAIVNRTFEWPVPSITLFVPAEKKMLTELARLKDLSSIVFGPDPQIKTLFNHQINLGIGTIRLEDTVIDNVDELAQEITKNDSHVVNVVIRSSSRRALYSLPNAPRLPASPWNFQIQSLIELGNQLDSKLADRYNALASATLAGLNDDERAELTTRPLLDEDAFEMS